jgi:hypothetical protein
MGCGNNATSRLDTERKRRNDDFNMAIEPTTNRSVDAFSSNPTQLILDLSSYFAP